MALSIKEAQRLGLIPKPEQPTKAKKPDEITHWTRSNIEDWDGPDGWHVGIARQLGESGMVDMVVAWREGKPGMWQVVAWEEFRKWSIEQTIARLRELEGQG